jgi:tetratricopeptide (TPR) repeat protein
MVMLKVLPLLIFFVVAGCAHAPRHEPVISPKEVQSRLELAENYLVAAEPRSALEQLRLIKNQAHDNPSLYFFLGVAHELLNDPERSIQAYEQAVSIDPSFGEAWNNLGQVRQAIGEFEASARAYEQALALEGYMTPEFAAYNMASLMAEQGRLDEALAYSRLGMEKNRRYIPLYQQSSDLLRRTGRIEEAVEVLETGVLARPDNPDLKIMLAEELIRAGRERDARKWFLQVMEQEPESDAARTAAGYMEVIR